MFSRYITTRSFSLVTATVQVYRTGDMTIGTNGSTAVSIPFIPDYVQCLAHLAPAYVTAGAGNWQVSDVFLTGSHAYTANNEGFTCLSKVSTPAEIYLSADEVVYFLPNQANGNHQYLAPSKLVFNCYAAQF